MPDQTAWKYHVRIEARMRLLRSRSELDPRRFAAYQDLLDKENPSLIRNVVRWRDEVDSLREFDHNGYPAKIAIGKAVLLESAVNWIGNFELDDPETMAIFNEYVGRT